MQIDGKFSQNRKSKQHDLKIFLPTLSEKVRNWTRMKARSHTVICLRSEKGVAPK